MTINLSRNSHLPAGTWEGDPRAPWNASGSLGECCLCDVGISEDVEDDVAVRRGWAGDELLVCPDCRARGLDICEICGDHLEDGAAACTECNCLRPSHGDDPVRG